MHAGKNSACYLHLFNESIGSLLFEATDHFEKKQYILCSLTSRTPGSLCDIHMDLRRQPVKIFLKIKTQQC